MTGDIVSSSEFSPEIRARLPDLLRTVGNQVREHFAQAVPYPIDIFRGDSWQLAVVHPELSLRVALDLRCRLHSLDLAVPILTRIGIGIGDVDFIPEDTLSEGDGTAFRLSGMALEGIDRPRNLAIRVAEAYAPNAWEALPVIATMMDAIANRWTTRQSQAISGVLQDLTQEQVGSIWLPQSISQQAVAQHLDSAGWSAISTGLHFFERVIGAMSDHTSPSNASTAGDLP